MKSYTNYGHTDSMRLWSIEDAKDGDILVCNINKADFGGDIENLPSVTRTICIYQNVEKDQDYIHSYCSLYEKKFFVLQNRMFYKKFIYNIQPATKGQRDLLFKKIYDAGYEWDAEKKELKKMEVASKEGDDERIRKAIHIYLDWLDGRENYQPKGVYTIRDMIDWVIKQDKKISADKVIEWLNDQACQGWIEDVEVDKFIEKFKKDFGL